MNEAVSGTWLRGSHHTPDAGWRDARDPEHRVVGVYRCWGNAVPRRVALPTGRTFRANHAFTRASASGSSGNSSSNLAPRFRGVTIAGPIGVVGWGFGFGCRLGGLAVTMVIGLTCRRNKPQRNRLIAIKWRHRPGRLGRDRPRLPAYQKLINIKKNVHRDRRISGTPAVVPPTGNAIGSMGQAHSAQCAPVSGHRWPE